jgi:predicted outer membrane repeat protein
VKYNKTHNAPETIHTGKNLLAAHWAAPATLGVAFSLFAPASLQAAGVVGNGSAAGCTSAALASALDGGGTVSFNCGSTPITIGIGEQQIKANTVINGDSRVTLSGANANRLFNVAIGKNLTLKNIGLANGRTTGQGAAVYAPNSSYITVNRCQFSNNVAAKGGQVGGGAIYSGNGNVSVNNSTFTGNKASIGGAILLLNSNLSLVASTFIDNKAVNATLGNGGAIYVDGAKGDNGVIDIRQSTFKSNTAPTYGGALFSNVYNNNKTNISNSVFTGNYAGSGSNGQGGAIWSNGDATKGGHWVVNTNNTLLTITNTTLANNTALQQGGGIWISRHKAATISQSAVYGNVAQKNMGGGIVQANAGSLSLVNSTVSGNKANGTYSMGAGVYVANAAKASLLNVTIANNVAAWQAGGIFGRANVTLKNTILANNIALNGGNNWDIQHNCAQTMINGGNNLQYPKPRDTACTPGILIANPLLGSLKNNGGPTLTHALMFDSAAVKRATGCPAIDQRGVIRSLGALCDIGAFSTKF